MNSFDLVILVILAIGAFKGFRRGFLMEIVSIIALVLGIVGGLKLLQWGMQIISEYTEINTQLLPYLSFLVIFIVIIVLVNLLGRAIKKVIDLTLLGNLDDMGGAVLGIIKWSFGFSAFIWITESFQMNFIERFAEHSAIYPWISGFAPAVVGFISGAFPFVDNLLELIQEFIGQHQ